MTTSTDNIDHALENLVDKVVEGFETVVAQETDLSNILLKGHLFIENFIEELIAALDIHNGISVHRLSFSDKLKQLKIYQEKNQKEYIANKVNELLPILYAVNQIRNNLAHDYNFILTESSIDKIGANLGSKYILNKYSEGRSHIKENLIFCLKTSIEEIGRIIFHRISNLNEEKKKEQAEKKV